ncbi:hypothetical protein B0J18DRAFT_440612 [Chaetomium sp. MPI-SDFR-AT-0129]|nr:hypothetical protein B0J18DRAFT_440612 [Chaetomium sp. MPI-SDFR-AT-0129]
MISVVLCFCLLGIIYLINYTTSPSWRFPFLPLQARKLSIPSQYISLFVVLIPFLCDHSRPIAGMLAASANHLSCYPRHAPFAMT